jgi:hypothetical protein
MTASQSLSARATNEQLVRSPVATEKRDTGSRTTGWDRETATTWCPADRALSTPSPPVLPGTYDSNLHALGLLSAVGHSRKTLTLQALERDGLVRRTVHGTIPARVDYALTDLGCSLTVPLSSLACWAGAHRAAMERARRDFDLAGSAS